MKSHDPRLLSVRGPLLTSRVADSNSAVILGCSRNNSAVGPVFSIGVQSQWGEGTQEVLRTLLALPSSCLHSL